MNEAERRSLRVFIYFIFGILKMKAKKQDKLKNMKLDVLGVVYKITGIDQAQNFLLTPIFSGNAKISEETMKIWTLLSNKTALSRIKRKK